MKKLRGEAGFTLVELIVCIVVGAIIIGSLTNVINNYVHVSARSRYLNLANSYVEAKVEYLRNQGFLAINTGTTTLTSELPTQMPRVRSASMVVSSPTTGIKQIDITVTFKDQGKNFSYGYTTYIGELGVGQ